MLNSYNLENGLLVENILFFIGTYHYFILPNMHHCVINKVGCHSVVSQNEDTRYTSHD